MRNAFNQGFKTNFSACFWRSLEQNPSKSRAFLFSSSESNAQTTWRVIGLNKTALRIEWRTEKEMTTLKRFKIESYLGIETEHLVKRI